MKKNKIIIISVFAFLSLVLLFFAFSKKEELKTGFLLVNTEPKESIVFIEGKEYRAGEKISLLPKNYLVEVKKEGYQAYSSQDISIKKGETTELNIKLKKELTVEEKNLLSILPKETIDYKISYSYKEDGSVLYEIRLYAINNGRPGQEITWKQELSLYKNRALSWILSQSIEPEKLNIIYVPDIAKDL